MKIYSIDIFVLIGVILVILKLTNKITLNWWLTLLPFYGIFVVGILFGLICATIGWFCYRFGGYHKFLRWLIK